MYAVENECTNKYLSHDESFDFRAIGSSLARPGVDKLPMEKRGNEHGRFPDELNKQGDWISSESYNFYIGRIHAFEIRICPSMLSIFWLCFATSTIRTDSALHAQAHSYIGAEFYTFRDISTPKCIVFAEICHIV